MIPTLTRQSAFSMLEVMITVFIIFAVIAASMLFLDFSNESKISVIKKDISSMLRMASIDYGELSNTAERHSPQYLFSTRMKITSKKTTNEVFGPGTLHVRNHQNIDMFIPPGGWDIAHNYAPETKPPQVGTVIQIRIGKQDVCISTSKDGNYIAARTGTCIPVIATLPTMPATAVPVNDGPPQL